MTFELLTSRDRSHFVPARMSSQGGRHGGGRDFPLGAGLGLERPVVEPSDNELTWALRRGYLVWLKAKKR